MGVGVGTATFFPHPYLLEMLNDKVASSVSILSKINFALPPSSFGSHVTLTCISNE